MYTSKVLNTPFNKSDVHNALSMPIYNNVAFEFDSAESMEAAFLGQKKSHTYSRISNPTVEHFEDRVKQLSGASYVTALASGMAAISHVFMTLAYSGSNIVTSTRLFGNTFSFFKSSLEAFGVEVRFCDLLDLADVVKHIDEHTCAVFTEIISNPHLEVPNLSQLSSLAHKLNVPLVADTTLIPWCAFRAAEFGVDIEVISTTKYISGGATSLGGLIVDHTRFDYSNCKRFKQITQVPTTERFNFKLRNEIARNFGASMSAQTAYMQSLGLETLTLRYQQASNTCARLAQFLKDQPAVKSVGYTSLKDHPFYEISQKQFGENAGSMLTFNLSDQATCFKFMNKLNVIRRATNLFDNRSLIIHPLSTIYGTLSPENKQLVNVSPNLIRLSVGLEQLEVLEQDINQALSDLN